MNKIERWRQYVAANEDKTVDQLAKIHRQLCKEASRITGEAALTKRLHRMKLREKKIA